MLVYVNCNRINEYPHQSGSLISDNKNIWISNISGAFSTQYTENRYHVIPGEGRNHLIVPRFLTCLSDIVVNMEDTFFRGKSDFKRSRFVLFNKAMPDVRAEVYRGTIELHHDSSCLILRRYRKSVRAHSMEKA